MRFKLLLVALCSLWCLQANAAKQNGYAIQLQMQDCTDSVLYLAHYYAKAEKVYKIDSARKTNNGEFLFRSDSTLVGGLYVILNNARTNLLEFVLQNGDDFSVHFTKGKSTETAAFKGTTENTLFFAYNKFLVSMQAEAQVAANLQMLKTKKDSAKALEINAGINKKITDYRLDLIKKNPKTLVAALFQDMQEPDIPKYLDKQKDASVARYNYYKQNYWNTFRFDQEAIVRTPILDKKVANYFKLVVSVPDTFNVEADKLLTKCRQSPELFKYMLNWLTYYAESSTVMGMDESFVYLIENYYMKGDAKPWLHDTVLAKYIERAKAIAPNMLGQVAADIRIPDITENIVSLQAFCKQQDYTLLIFYDPTCGHCKKEIPASDSVVQKLRNNKIDIKIFGVENAQEDEKWKAFIAEKNLDKDYWLHLHDPKHIGGFRKNYDVRTNPVIYLIDRKGIIVGKRINHEVLEGLVKNLEKKRKDKN